MKKICMAALFALATLQGQGQEVYNHLYESATQVMNNPEASESQTKINHFYVTALNYLKGTASAKMESVTTTFLDTQAYYLSEFVGSFFRNVSSAHKVSAECQHGVVMAYVNATLDNPLFNDPDKEKVHSFVGDNTYLTPFSIDTDWEKAYNAATKKADELLK